MPLGMFLGVRGGVFLPPSEMLTAHGEDISHHVPGSVLGWPLLEDVLPHFSTSGYICSSRMSSNHTWESHVQISV